MGRGKIVSRHEVDAAAPLERILLRLGQDAPSSGSLAARPGIAQCAKGARPYGVFRALALDAACR